MRYVRAAHPNSHDLLGGNSAGDGIEPALGPDELEEDGEYLIDREGAGGLVDNDLGQWQSGMSHTGVTSGLETRTLNGTPAVHKAP